MPSRGSALAQKLTTNRGRGSGDKQQWWAKHRMTGRNREARAAPVGLREWSLRERGTRKGAQRDARRNARGGSRLFQQPAAADRLAHLIAPLVKVVDGTRDEQITECRRLLGWLDAGIERVATRRHRKPTRKERARLAYIRRRVGGGAYAMRRLRAVRVKQAEFLSVQVARRREARELASRRREKERAERLGAKR